MSLHQQLLYISVRDCYGFSVGIEIAHGIHVNDRQKKIHYLMASAVLFALFV